MRLGVYPNLWYLGDIYNGRMSKNIPTLVRLRPETKAMLVRAASEQRRSQSSLVDTLIVDNLAQYRDLSDRLAAMLDDANSDPLRHDALPGTADT